MLSPKGNLFLKQIFQDAESWQERSKAQDWDCADKLLQKALERCKDTLLSSDDSGEKNTALLNGILVRGLQDATQLFRLVSTEGWGEDTSKIEDAWKNLCDAQERLSYVSTFINLTNLTWLIGHLNAIDAEFMRALGPGIYNSPEILIKKALCSVCGQNIKGCDHIPGHLYNGVLCASIAQEIEPKSVSIVKYPKDRRCRIWPWRSTGENQYRVILMTTFRLDDFLDEPEKRRPNDV